METSIHCNSDGMVVTGEMPWNSNCLMLSPKDNLTAKICLYLPLEQWWLLRQLPKANDYIYYTDHTKGETNITDSNEAEDAALAFYQSAKAKAKS